jgi:Host cell surface-exposed lipoprotein.
MRTKKMLCYFLTIAIIASCVLRLNPGDSVRAADTNAIRTFVSSLYTDCLGRNPDPSGLNDWVEQLSTHQISGKECAYGFFFSDEFAAKANNMSDSAFVNCFYKVFLNRSADPEGRAYWTNAIQSTWYDTTTLFTGFADSDEFAQKCASYGIDAGEHIEVPNVARGQASTPSAPATTQQSTTTSQRNAVSTAQDYLRFMSFSRSGLIDQLEFEGFSTADATYGVDNCGADWNAQAISSAQSYLRLFSFSRRQLIDQLIFEGFTTAQAENAANAVGLR